MNRQYNNNNNNNNNYNQNNNHHQQQFYNNNQNYSNNNNQYHHQQQHNQQQHHHQHQQQYYQQPQQQNEDYIFGQLNEMFNNIDSSNDGIKKIREWIMNNCYSSNMVIDFMCNKITNLYPEQRLFLLFLINDILHFSQFNRSENRPEYFIHQFYQSLPKILSNIYYIINPAMRDQVQNILNLWIDRRIYSKHEVEELRKSLKKSPPPGVPIMPGMIVSHLRLSKDTTAPFNSDNIDYYHLYNFDRSNNNKSLHESMNKFYSILYNENR